MVGERDKLLAQQAAIIKKHEVAEKKDLRDTQKAIAALAVKVKKVDAPNFKDFKVSWETEGGEPVELKRDGLMTLKELTDTIRSVPQTAFQKLKAISGNNKQVRGNRLDLISSYEKRAQQRRTKIFHAHERIGQLKVGT